MKHFVEYTEDVTGKTVIWHHRNVWFQDETEITTPKHDFEGVFHELAHWIVALPKERRAPNLMLAPAGDHVIYDPELSENRVAMMEDEHRSIRREKQARFLQFRAAEAAKNWSPKAIDELEKVETEHGKIGWYQNLDPRQRAARLGVIRSRFDKTKTSFRELIDVLEATRLEETP